MQTCLRMLKSNSAKQSYIYNDFALTQNHVRRFSIQICKKHSVQNPWNIEMVETSDILAF
jgi:hypothetical protein